MSAPDAAAVVDRLILLVLAIAARTARFHRHLADELRSEVSYQLWRSLLRHPSADTFGPALAVVVARRACWRVVARDLRDRRRRSDADVAGLGLASRECDPAFLAAVNEAVGP